MDWLAVPFQGLSGVITTGIDNLEWWQLTLVIIDFCLRIIALGWVPADRRPSSAMAWLLAIFLIPYVGIILFLMMGGGR